jgi:hypothetical protein
MCEKYNNAINIFVEHDVLILETVLFVGAINLLHLQGRKVWQARHNRWMLLLPASAGFLSGFPFHLEAQQICSSENVGPFSGYTALQHTIFKNTRVYSPIT